MRTADLEGIALNWAVAECNSKLISSNYCVQGPYFIILANDGDLVYSPSTDWRQGGEIIAREHIEFRLESGMQYRASIGIFGGVATGPTHLVAAMRAYVTDMVGDDIDVPEILYDS